MICSGLGRNVGSGEMKKCEDTWLNEGVIITVSEQQKWNAQQCTIQLIAVALQNRDGNVGAGVLHLGRAAQGVGVQLVGGKMGF